LRIKFIKKAKEVITMWNWLFGRKEATIDLETALESIPWTPFKISVSCSEEGMVTRSEFPVYCIPAKTIEGEFYLGLYTKEGLTYVPAGFSLEDNFKNEYYDGEAALGSYFEEKPKGGLLYLPLQRSEVPVGLAYDADDGKEGRMASWLYSIAHATHEFPFTLLTTSHEGLKVYAFASNIELPGYFSRISSIRSKYTALPFPNISNDKLQEYFDQLRNGTYRFPKISEEEGRKLIITTSQKNSTTKTEKSVPKTSAKAINVSSKKAEPKPLITADEEIDWHRPKSIKTYLDRYLIGQEDAKRTVAVAFSNYMTRVRSGNPDLPKDNLLLIGPSGTGKTYLMSLLAKKASLPFAETKAVGKSDEGYKGENLSTVFEQIRSKTTEEAPAGIVFIDEIDKLASGGDTGRMRDSLQDEVIGWAEETVIYGDTNSNKKPKPINTRNILFAIAGAFQGTGRDALESIIKRRLRSKQGRTIGFGSQVEIQTPEDAEKILSSVTPEDLIEYGLKPELIGRFSSMGILHKLDQEQKIRILTEAEGSRLKQYKALFQEKGYSLELEESVYALIVNAAPEETGARGLSAICNDLFTDYLYDPAEFADDDGVILVTEENARKFIKGNHKPTMKA